MKYFIFLTTLFFPLFVSAQDPLEKCQLAMVSWNPYIKKMSVSENDKYIVITGPVEAKIFELVGSDYQLRKKLKLAERFPRHAIIINSGNLIIYGQERIFGSGAVQSDTIYLYKNIGRHLEKINADSIYSNSQIQESIKKYELSNDCTPKRPWICHTRDPELTYGEEILTVFNTLGRGVNIDLDTLGIETWRSSPCEMFRSDRN